MYIYMLALNYDANSSITYYHCCLVDFEELVHATVRKELKSLLNRCGLFPLHCNMEYLL